MTVTETTNQQLLLAAYLMARPDYLPAIFPANNSRDGADLRLLDNEVARTAVYVLVTQGPTFANTSAMLSALSDSDEMLDEGDVRALIQLVPGPFDEELTLEQVIDLKHSIERARVAQRLQSRLTAASEVFTSDPDGALDRLESAIREYRQGSVGKDATATGILERMRQGSSTTRWKVGYNVPGGELLDDVAPGINPQGEFDTGLSGQGEIMVIAAQYGVGKTRLVLNWMAALLDQGASLSLIALEDNEAAFSAKLVGIRWNIEKWQIERYLHSTPLFVNKSGLEVAQRVEEALSWYSDLGGRVRMYDGQSDVNIFNFRSTKALIAQDAQLYGTTHTIIDYINAYPGEVTTLEGYAQELRETAARNNVGLMLLSQVSNETMKFGTAAGVVPTRGSSAWGAIAHYGFHLTTDPEYGQRELQIAMPKGRDGGANLVYASVNVDTGKVTQYNAMPLLINTPELGGEKKKGGRK